MNPIAKGVVDASQARKVEVGSRKRKRALSPSSPNSSFNLGIFQPSSSASSSTSHSRSIPRPKMPSLVRLPTRNLSRFHRAVWAAAAHLSRPILHRQLAERVQSVQSAPAPTVSGVCPNVPPDLDPERKARRVRARGKPCLHDKPLVPNPQPHLVRSTHRSAKGRLRAPPSPSACMAPCSRRTDASVQVWRTQRQVERTVEGQAQQRVQYQWAQTQLDRPAVPTTHPTPQVLAATHSSSSRNSWVRRD